MTTNTTNTVLQPPPILTPILNTNGTVSDPWYRFFRNLVNRLGGGTENHINYAITEVNNTIIQQAGDAEIDTSAMQFRDEYINEQAMLLYNVEPPIGLALDQDDYNLIWTLNDVNPGMLYQWYQDKLAPLTNKGDLLTRNNYENIRLPVGSNGQVVVANSSTDSGLEWQFTGVAEFLFDYGDATPKPLFTISINKIIFQVELVIITPFNDFASSLSVGDAGDTQRLMATTDNLSTIAGTYWSEPGYKYLSATPLILTITPGTSTQGSGLVKIIYQK